MNTLTLETGVSDDHKLIGTILTVFAKGKPENFYRSCKNLVKKSLKRNKKAFIFSAGC